MRGTPPLGATLHQNAVIRKVTVDRETLDACTVGDRGDGRGGEPHFFVERERGIEDLVAGPSAIGGSSALLIYTRAHLDKHRRLSKVSPSALQVYLDIQYCSIKGVSCLERTF